jgi:putative FmdB family regulatory protein
MPIYEYRCESCSQVFEALRRMGESTKGLACPACGSKKLEQVFSSFAAGGGTSRGDAGGRSGGGCAPSGFG